MLDLRLKTDLVCEIGPRTIAEHALPFKPCESQKQLLLYQRILINEGVFAASLS